MTAREVDLTQKLGEYLATIIEWEETVLSNPKKGNRIFDRNHKLYKFLRNYPEGRSGISSLMADPRPGVRLMAATHSLAWDESRAVATLEALEAEPNLRAVSAKYTLREFRSGKLNLDW